MVWSGIIKDELVEYDSKNNTSKCRVCKKLLKGKMLGNIKRHYRIIHNYKNEDFPCIKRTNGPADCSGDEPPPAKQPKRESYDEEEYSQSSYEVDKTNTNTSKATLQDCSPTKRNAAAIALTEEMFLNCCVGLVAVQQLPLSLFDDHKYFHPLIQSYEDAFNMPLTSTNVLHHVKDAAREVREALGERFANKMLNLKLDVIGTKMNAQLVVHAYYMQDQSVMVSTLGMMPLRHLEIQGADKFTSFLKEFEVSASGNVYSVTWDFGAVPVVCDPKPEDKELFYETAEQFETEGDIIVGDLTEIFVGLTKCPANILRHLTEEVFTNVRRQMNAQPAMVRLLRQNDAGCGAGDAGAFVENSSSDELAVGCSWKPVYDLVEAMTNGKVVIPKNLEHDWAFCGSFVAAFRPIAEFHRQLEAVPHVLFGDFFRDWLLCVAKLKKVASSPGGNECASKLLKAMKQDEAILKENGQLLAALYMDPRFNFTDSPFLNETQKTLALETIMDAHKLLPNVKDAEKATPSDNAAAPGDCSTDEYSILEEELLMLTTGIEEPKLGIRQKLENLAHGQRLPFGTDVLQYWKNQSAQEKELYQLSRFVLLMPANQATVKRSCHALQTLVQRNVTHKPQLTGEDIGALTVLHMNPDYL